MYHSPMSQAGCCKCAWVCFLSLLKQEVNFTSFEQVCILQQLEHSTTVRTNGIWALKEMPCRQVPCKQFCLKWTVMHFKLCPSGTLFFSEGMRTTVFPYSFSTKMPKDILLHDIRSRSLSDNVKLPRIHFSPNRFFFSLNYTTPPPPLQVWIC